MTRRQTASNSREERRGRRGRSAALVCGISVVLVIAVGTLTVHTMAPDHAVRTTDATARQLRGAASGEPFTAAAAPQAASRATTPATIFLVETQAAAERILTDRDQANITHAMAGEPLLNTEVVVATSSEQVDRLRSASAGLSGYPASVVQLVDLRPVSGEPTNTGARTSTAASLEEENKAIVRRVWAELHDQGNVAVAEELLTPDSVLHISGARDITGVEAIKRFLVKETTGFPDSHYTIEDMVAEGDRVVTRWTYLGTFTGDYYGMPPTGAQLTSLGISIHRLVDGKVAESWWVYDTLNWEKQLGLVQAP